MGLGSWGVTVVAAARAFRDEHGHTPAVGAQARAATPEHAASGDYALHSFGAQFAEVRVDRDTGEVRVPRMLGVFNVSRIVNHDLAEYHVRAWTGLCTGSSSIWSARTSCSPRCSQGVGRRSAGGRRRGVVGLRRRGRTSSPSWRRLFRPARHVADTAPALDRLVAFLGREVPAT